MAESRDRITRPVDLAGVFARRRSGPLGIISDEALNLFGSPVRQHSPTGVVGTPVLTAGGGGFRRNNISFRTRHNRNLYRSTGRENIPVLTSPLSRGRGNLLPSWYPRTPLRDITAVARAIGRRRSRLGDGEGLIVGTPTTTTTTGVVGANVSSDAQYELNLSTPASSSTPRLKKKPCPQSVRTVSKILLSVTNKNEESEELLTPQKKLLNSIDTVEKAVMEELEKLKKTPSAKKAERQYKVRTLMSMR